MDAGNDGRSGLGSLWSRLELGPVAGEGLRDRKKRLTRQTISATATRLFLERGFDGVRVAEVAEACGVSEKTVFNYFPTKEALLFDREEEVARGLRAALGRRNAGVSPITAALDVVTAEIEAVHQHLTDDDGPDQTTIARFGELVSSTPSLRAAQLAMRERLAQVAAQAMAERAGVDPQAPEPQIAAAAIVSLWSIQFQALCRYADGTRTADEVREAVLDDVGRAARLIDTGLWSFSVAVQGASGRQQLREAATAANEARKQVVAAIKQAREAWQALAEDHDHHHAADGDRSHHQLQERVARTLEKGHQKAHQHRQKVRMQEQEARMQEQKARLAEQRDGGQRERKARQPRAKDQGDGGEGEPPAGP